MNAQRSFPSVPLVKLGTSFNKVISASFSFPFPHRPSRSGERFSFPISKYSRLSGIGQFDRLR